MKKLTLGNNKKIGGVCSGIANYFGFDTFIVRLLFLFCGQISWCLYFILWILMDEE